MSTRQLTVLVAALVAGVVTSWLLLVPPGAHADEPSHLVRSGALVHRADGDDGFVVLPDRYLTPEPACYAFDPLTPVSCAAPADPVGDDVVMLTRADDYPPGAHLVYGLATLLPGIEPVWTARAASAVVGIAFLTAALVLTLRRSRLGAAAVLLGLTPMAWSTLPSVNPSAFAIAGAVALWVALLEFGTTSDVVPRIVPWVIALAWAALAVARRDGLVWACVIVFAAALLLRLDLVPLARRLGIGPLIVIAASTAVTLAWGLTSGSRTSQLVVVAPVALVAAEFARTRLRSAPVEARWWSWVIGAIAAVVAWFVLVSTRDGGWDTDLTVTIINQTDDNLIEAIGRLGWLDAPLPAFVVFAWLVAIGGLVAYALLANRRGLAAASLITVFAAVSSWTFELLQGNDTGTYWQGRYSLPLLVAVPLLLTGTARADDAVAHRALTEPLARWVGLTGLVIVNVAAWAAARRWGVGLEGSYLPWRWDTAIQPVPPIVLLVLLAGSSAGLAWVVLVRHDRHLVAR